eukprot:3924240-Rhodomonas_salina.3
MSVPIAECGTELAYAATRLLRPNAVLSWRMLLRACYALATQAVLEQSVEEGAGGIGAGTDVRPGMCSTALAYAATDVVLMRWRRHRRASRTSSALAYAATPCAVLVLLCGSELGTELAYGATRYGPLKPYPNCKCATPLLYCATLLSSRTLSLVRH